jgi:acetyl esterase/lipase
MRADQLTIAFNREFERKVERGKDIPPFLKGIQEIRRVWPAPCGAPPNPSSLDGGTIEEISGPTGRVPLLIFCPEDARGVFLYLHGGGWSFGSHIAHAGRWAKMAERIRAAIVSVGYRLAPESPYPAAPNDCETAALWLLENSRKRFGSQKLAIGGFSAGAHLAVVTLVRLRDKHQISSFRSAILTSGQYDLRMTPSARAWGKRKLVLTSALMKMAVDNFANGQDLSDPDVSPIFASLENLPPALFQVGTSDPFMDDTLFMAARWKAAGNETQLSVCAEGSHFYEQSPTPDGEKARIESESFLSSTLSN